MRLPRKRFLVPIAGNSFSVRTAFLLVQFGVVDLPGGSAHAEDGSGNKDAKKIRYKRREGRRPGPGRARQGENAGSSLRITAPLPFWKRTAMSSLSPRSKAGSRRS